MYYQCFLEFFLLTLTSTEFLSEFDRLGYKKEKIIRGYASRSEMQKVISGPTKSENPVFILANCWPSLIPFMTVKHPLYLNVCSLSPNHWDPNIVRKETVENPYLSEEVAETEIVFVLMFDDLIVNIGILYLKVIVKFIFFTISTSLPYFIRKLNLTDFISWGSP